MALLKIIKDSIHTAKAAEMRGWAACDYFSSAGRADPLADAKKRMFSQDVDGVTPFLDPFKPVSDERLAKVARKAKLSDEQRDEMVEQISATLGWDIRSGFPGKGG